MPGCSAFGCTNSYKRGYKLYRLPTGTSNEERRKLWLNNIGGEEKPNDQRKVCEVHFTEDQFENHRADNRRQLKPNAVPTLFSHHVGTEKQKNSVDFTNDNDQPCANTLGFPSTVSKVAQGNDPASVETYEFENVKSEIAPGNDPASVDTHVFENVKSEIEPDNDPTSVDTHEMEVAESEIVSVPELLQTGSIESPSNKGLIAKVENLKRKLSLLQKKLRQQKCDNENIKKHLSSLLTNDQIDWMKRGFNGNQVWSNETIEKALKIYLTCHTKGYNYLRGSGYPLPSLRTVQRRIQNFVMKPGISHEVLSLLKLKISSMLPEERYVCIMIDEMQITEGLEFDASTKCIIGTPTIPSTNGTFEETATHALVFLLGGVSTRWKQVVGYHFTGTSICTTTFKNTVFKIIQECEGIGLTIESIVSDMGPQNQAFWRECNVGVKRKSNRELEIKAFCPHPVNSSRKLYFVADAPHIIKNLQNHLTQDQVIYLPDEIVKQQNLSSNEVSIRHIKDMLSLEEKNNFKICPQLTTKCLDIGHDKMKVGPAHVLLSHAVAVGLKYYVNLKQLEENALVTAWFVEIIAKWFAIVTSRSFQTAMSEAKKDYNETITFLEYINAIMTNIKIGVRGLWKPVQAGVILTTTSMLGLQNLFLKQHKFKFLLLSRFSQDAIENLFSTVRLKNPVPNSKEFKTCLRMIILSQYFTSGVRGNSFIDTDKAMSTNIFQIYAELSSTYDNNCVSFDVDFEKNDEDIFNLNVSYHEKLSSDIDFEKEDIEMYSEIVEKDLPEIEESALYYMCGCVLKTVIKQGTLCQTCIETLDHKRSNSNSSKQMFTKLSEFHKDKWNLVYVSQEVYCILLHIENIFRANEERILRGDLDTKMLKSLMIISAWDHFKDFNTCCNLMEKLVKTFVTHRVHFLIKKKNQCIKSKIKKCLSRSIGMKAAASDIK